MLSYINTNKFKEIETPLFLILVCLMFIDYAGCGYYVFYFPLIYFILHKGYRLADPTFFLLILWGGLYAITCYLNYGSFSYSSFFVPLINFPLTYLFGKYLGRYNNPNYLYEIIFFICLSLGFVALISIFKDIQLNGFLTMNRNVPLIGLNPNVDIAATGLSSRLIPLAFYFVFFLIPLKRQQKIIYLVLSVLTIACLLRIQSRTSVLGSVVLLSMMILYCWKNISVGQRIAMLFILPLVLLIIAFILTNHASELGIIERFKNEDISTGGGRLQLIKNVINNIPKYPFGGMRCMYAHNIWLDCARLVGIFPFLLLLIITFRYYWDAVKLTFNRQLSLPSRCSLIIVSFSCLLIFFAEPVLEGIPMVFSLFCLVLGMLEEIKTKKIIC